MAILGLFAAIALAGCASEDLQSKYEEQQKLNLDLAAQNDDLKTARAEAISRQEALAGQLKQTDMEAQKARQAADALAKQNEELRNRVAAPAAKVEAGSTANGNDMAAMKALVAQLKAELGKQADGVGLTKDGNIEITLASDVNFGSGSADLSEAGKKSLKAISPLLKGKFAPYQIRVEGHTDATPLAKTKTKFSDNFGLGSARSLSVVRFMETDLGIEPTRLMSASRGEHEPVADNKSDTGKKQNRRVEIVVVVPHDAALSMSK
jgi:chemotaxis protein MotB